MVIKKQIKEKLIDATWEIQNFDKNAGYGMCRMREEIDKLFALK